ncbi:MAG: glycosyltransferase family 4 protein [Thermoanaerobaculia bacterium]|nr:glycosyltransferase family 4 protein [Thermoanaerobaculia bacterium]
MCTVTRQSRPDRVAPDQVAPDRVAPDRVAVDWVSPLPPVRSGISDYSVDLLPHLAQRCDLRVVHLPGQPVRDDLVERWRPVMAADSEPGRVPIYQMGNNHHHVEVWNAAQQQPGLVVLHDLVLHHFLIERTVKEEDFEGYRRQLAIDHGWIGDAAALPFRWPGGAGSSAQFALPAHRSLLARQRGVLVHSQWARDFLREELGGDYPDLRVRVLPMGIPLPPEPAADAGDDFRQRHGIPKDAPVLGSFGFQTPMKRTEEVIWALAEPELADTHLMVAGEVAPILEFDRIIAEAGVEDRVHVLGFLDWDEFAAAIAACDLALNLRYPTAGETSASLLRILALGRPAVVSDHAQMAELPDDVVIKIPVGEGERRALAERLSVLLADRERLAHLGQCARRHIAEQHRLEDAADALVAAAANWGDLSPLAGKAGEIEAIGSVPRPTSLAWHRMTGRLDVEGTEDWQPGERRTVRVRLTNESQAVWLAGERPSGGVALQAKLWVDGVDLLADRGWRGLPYDLEPGAAAEFSWSLRRPPAGDTELEILPHVLDFTGFPDLEGPAWRRSL